MDCWNYWWFSCGLLSKKEPEMSKPFQLKLIWKSLVFFARTRLPIKHTTISINITITNVIITSPMSHLPPVLFYKKGSWFWENSQDVINTLEYHLSFLVHCTFFVGLCYKALHMICIIEHIALQTDYNVILQSHMCLIILYQNFVILW